jgi:HlyD family secretion protein
VKHWIAQNKKIAFVSVGVLLVLAVVFGIVRIRAAGSSPTEGASSAAQQNSEIDAWGEVKYNKAVDVTVDFPAAVTDVAVKEGDRVTLGQTLVTLDLSEYQGNLEKLKQQVAANQAGMPAATQSISALEADIAETQSVLNRKTGEYGSGTAPDLKTAQNALSLAQKQESDAARDLQNYQSLYKSGAVSKSVLDQYTSAHDQKQTALANAQAAFRKAQTALKDEIDQMSVSLKSKQTQLDNLKNGNTANTGKQKAGLSSAQVDLNLMTARGAKDFLNGNKIVCSLKNGIVQGVSVINADHLGVQNAPTKVLQIIDADSLTVSAEVNEEFIGSVKLGETVRIVPTSAPDKTLSGTVTQIPNLAQEKDGKRVVRVLVKPQDSNGLLKPGYTADVYFPTK